MDNYRGKSKVNTHDGQSNKIDLELKLGQSAFEEQINLGGVHAFSSMNGQSTHHMVFIFNFFVQYSLLLQLFFLLFSL